MLVMWPYFIKQAQQDEYSSKGTAQYVIRAEDGYPAGSHLRIPGKA